MAEKKVIDLEVKDNIEPTIRNLKLLKNQLKDTAAGSKEFDKLSAQIRDLDDSIADAKKSNDDFLGQLENASGPLGMLGKSIRGAETTFSSFNGALKASVIGLIVGLVGGLVAAFSNNETAIKKIQPLLDGMQKIFQGIFRAVEPLFNTLVDLAISALPMVSKAFGVVYSSVTAVFDSLGAIGSAVKKLISGDFSGAFKDAKSSVTDFSKNYDASVKRFNSGTKEMTANEKAEAEKRAESLQKETDKRKAQEEKRLQNVKAHNEKLKAEREKAALEEAEFQAAHKEFLNKLDSDSFAARMLKAKEDEAVQKEENLILSLEEATAAAEVANQDENNRVKTFEKKKRTAEEEVEFQKAKDQAIASSKANLNNIIAGLEASGLAKTKAGQVISKAIALTQIGIDSAIAISKASTLANAEGVAAQLAFPTLPGIGTVARVLSYASTAASVIGNISRAKQLLSSGGGGGSAPTGGSAPSLPTGGGRNDNASTPPSFNVVGASSTNQLAQTIGNQQQQPIKAYVVANDVTTQQSLDRNIIKSATIG